MRHPDTIWIENVDADPHWATVPDGLRGRGTPHCPRPYRRVRVPDRSSPPAGSVWLSPACCDEARLWCEDDPGPCEDCDAKWIPYRPVWDTSRPEQWRGQT